MPAPWLLIEDGTGVIDANVYDSVETAAAWLGLRACPSFGEETPEDQATILVLATEIVEHGPRVRARLRSSRKLSPDQGLLFPRCGAVGEDGDFLPSNTVPRDYRHGIFYMAEHFSIAARRGERLTLYTPDSKVRFENWASFRGVGIEYHTVRNFWDDYYPDVWALVRTVFPPFIRSERC